MNTPSHEPLTENRPITDTRIHTYFEGLSGKGFQLPSGEQVRKYRDEVLKALLAQELYEFATYPRMERVLLGENFISPWIPYDKSKLPQ